MHNKVIEHTENKIEELLDQGITEESVGYLYKLIDIHKDIENENYWKEKLDIMRYRGNYSGNYRGRDGDELPNMYGNDSYGRRARDSRGRYMDGSSYGRRGVDAKYRGDDMMNEAMDRYHDYRESGNYGDKNESIKSLDYMLKSVEDFMCMLQDEASSQEEVEMIKKSAKRISDM